MNWAQVQTSCLLAKPSKLEVLPSFTFHLACLQSWKCNWKIKLERKTQSVKNGASLMLKNAKMPPSAINLICAKMQQESLSIASNKHVGKQFGLNWPCQMIPQNEQSAFKNMQCVFLETENCINWNPNFWQFCTTAMIPHDVTQNITLKRKWIMWLLSKLTKNL